MKPRTLGKRKVALKQRIVFDYAPTKRQEQFHKAKQTYKLYGGAMGGGKSYALCAEAIRLCMKYPGNRLYFCRQYITDFKRSTLVCFSNLCPPELIRGHYRDDRIIEFVNGSEIIYGGLGGEDDLERIKSTEFGAVLIDEATETELDFFLLLCSRLRWKLPGGHYPDFKICLASNPEPGWVKERFLDDKLPDHVFVPALPRDNPYLPKDYDANLRRAYPPEWVKRYLDGSWDVFEGQIYKEFNRDKHVYKDLDVGINWRSYRVIDHGYTNPTACLYVKNDYDGQLWIHDEHYEAGLTIEENARIIKAKEPHFDGVTLIDPSCFNNTMQKGGKPCSVADIYRENGVTCISPYSQDGWAAEGLGINMVKQYLSSERLHIHEDCTHTIREILQYRWRKLKAGEARNKNTPEVPVDKNNHACDCLRYMCIWRPLGSTPPEDPKNKNSWSYAIQEHKRKQGQMKFIGW